MRALTGFSYATLILSANQTTWPRRKRREYNLIFLVYLSQVFKDHCCTVSCFRGYRPDNTNFLLPPHEDSILTSVPDGGSFRHHMMISGVLSKLGWYLVKSVPPVPADLIVVLSGGWSGARIKHAALLVSEGYAKKVLVSGPLILYGNRETDLAIPWAVQQGFPESIFVAVPNDAYNTEGEAREMLSAARRYGAKRILIVTHNYHTRRASAIFSRRAPDLEIHVMAAPDVNFSPDSWWRNRTGRKIFCTEWTSTVLFWFGCLSTMFSKSRRSESGS